MEELRQAFVKKGLEVPERMMELLEEDVSGAAGRRRVYGRLYAVWRTSTGGCGRVVWPIEVRQAVRQIVVAEEGEEQGRYDAQHQDNPQSKHLSLEELAAVDWSARPSSNPKPVNRRGCKRKAEDKK